jgi:Gas vesicle synthesis protein GvpL/GvpF
MIELLAIGEPGVTPEPPVRAVQSDGVSVLCTPAPEGGRTAEDLWRREALVERLLEAGPLLPVRMGTLVADEDAAAAAVAGRGAELRSRLEHVRGAVELAVRIQPAAPARDLRARAALLAAAEGVHDDLSALARDTAERPGPELLRAAHLVERNRVERFVARVHELQAQHPDLAILCTGPWPAYSFAPEPER